MKNLFVVFIFLGIACQTFSQSREVPFTLDDRDRIMRTEEKLIALENKLDNSNGSLHNEIGSLRSEMNARFEAVDSRFNSMDSKFAAMDSKFETLYWAFGIVIALIMFLLGYIIWDRRTALNPVQDKTNNLENRLTKLEIIAKEQARKDPIFAELLRHTGIL